MPNGMHVARILAGIGAIALLLLPSVIGALVWTPFNLCFVGVALILTIICARRVSGFKWFLALLTSSFVALPPYPNWLYWSDNKGWHLWLGPSLRNWELGANLIILLISLMLFAALFWAIRWREPSVVP